MASPQVVKQPQPIQGTVAFIQHHLPPLEAGDYRLYIRQEVSAAATDADGLFSQHDFSVFGERFRLDPAAVDKYFPPANSQGDYGNVLPHLVTTRKTLPWERLPEADGVVTLGTPIDATDDPKYQDVATWLALLVFDEDDFQASPADWLVIRRPKTVTLQNLFDTASPTWSYFTEAKQNGKSVADVLDYGEQASDRCQVIDVPLAVFNQIAPSLDDLKWLAHARTIDRGNGAPAHDYAAIVANRLPQIGVHSVVHLVSLEGLGNYLHGGSGPSQDYDHIRLVSLMHWTFTATAETHSFAWYLEHLNAGDGDDALLRWHGAEPASNPVAKTALAQGYLPLPHTTRLGDETVSWYRGPFIPATSAFDIYSAQLAPLLLPARSADGITLYDQQTGLFDVSYAAAWQLGRLLALANKRFAVELYHWHNDQVQHALVQAGKSYRQKLQDVLDGYEQKPGPELETALSTFRGLWSTPPALSKELTDWLGRLFLLHGAPFNYLVADQSWLPLETIRFFHIDLSWLACLIDGALSVGRPTLSTWAVDLAFGTVFWQQIQTAALGIARQDATVPITELSGFLINSAVVHDWWPGFLVDAYPTIPTTFPPSAANSNPCARLNSPPACCWSSSTGTCKASTSASRLKACTLASTHWQAAMTTCPARPRRLRKILNLSPAAIVSPSPARRPQRANLCMAHRAKMLKQPSRLRSMSPIETPPAACSMSAPSRPTCTRRC